MLRENVIDLLCENVLMHINDPAIYEIWDQLTELLSNNVDDTIKYLKSCNKKELFYLSSVFEDIALKVQSKKYIQTLYELNEKYPDLNMLNDIELAEQCTNIGNKNEFYKFRSKIRKPLGRTVLFEEDREKYEMEIISLLKENKDITCNYIMFSTDNELAALKTVLKSYFAKNNDDELFKIITELSISKPQLNLL